MPEKSIDPNMVLLSVSVINVISAEGKSFEGRDSCGRMLSLDLLCADFFQFRRKKESIFFVLFQDFRIFEANN